MGGPALHAQALPAGLAARPHHPTRDLETALASARSGGPGSVAGHPGIAAMHSSPTTVLLAPAAVTHGGP